MRTYFLLFRSIFLPWDWILVLILASKIVPESSQDSSDASKSPQRAPKIDFGGPKSRPRAAKSVQDAPERVFLGSKMVPMPTSELTRSRQGCFGNIQTPSDSSWTERKRFLCSFRRSDLTLESPLFRFNNVHNRTKHIFQKTKACAFASHLNRTKSADPFRRRAC